MDDFIYSLENTKICTTFDAYYGYFQVYFSQEDEHKTVFVCQVGTYQYNRMRFGLTNVPVMFFGPHPNQDKIPYESHLLTWTKSARTPRRYTKTSIMYTTLYPASLQPGSLINKFHCFTSTTEYLWHFIEPGELHMD